MHIVGFLFSIVTNKILLIFKNPRQNGTILIFTNIILTQCTHILFALLNYLL
jgi:hypothetical protein